MASQEEAIARTQQRPNPDPVSKMTKAKRGGPGQPGRGPVAMPAKR